MPTHDSHCDICGQHRQAEADLRETMVALRELFDSNEQHSGSIAVDNIRRANAWNYAKVILARLDERYPK